MRKHAGTEKLLFSPPEHVMMASFVALVGSVAFAAFSPAPPAATLVGHRDNVMVLYVKTALASCSTCAASESTGNVKDLDLECCGTGTAGKIGTSDYALVAGICVGPPCTKTSDCTFAVTLTIGFGCHPELWILGPGRDPADDGRRTADQGSPPISLSCTALCKPTDPTSTCSAYDVKVYRDDCNNPGTRGTLVGEYNVTINCAKCNEVQ